MTDPDCHPGHRRYVGGTLDGHVAHLLHTTPSDYPQTIGTVLRDGQRSWYEIDYDASRGTEVVYRHIGNGRTIEDCR
jgi:hypothetical protein